MEFKDQMNRVFELTKTPKRIISLVPSQTELLVDLGLEEFIVGVTKFCIHPSSLRKTKSIVGGTKNINIDKIKALKPDIILCNKEENTKEIVEICEQIAPTHVSDIFTLDDSKELIIQYGEILSCKTAAENIIEKLDNEFVKFQQFIKNTEEKKVAYFIWKDPWMVAGHGTFISTMMNLAGVMNAAPASSDYPSLEAKEIQAINPEVVLLSTEPFPFVAKHKTEIELLLPDAEIHIVDGELFSWYGSRLLLAPPLIKNLRRKIGK